MNKKYCVNCGNEMETADRFCHNCGALVETKKKSPPLNNAQEKEFASNISSTKSVSESKKIRLGGKAVGVMILLVLLIALPFVAFSIGSIHRPLGVLTYQVPYSGITKVNLEVYNAIGSIEIAYDDSLTNLIEATIEVRGGMRASLEDAVNFDSSTTDDIITVIFNSGQQFLSFFRMNSLSYKIILLIHPMVLVDFDIATSTGSISFVLDGCDNLFIEKLFLSSSTGSIKVDSKSATNTTISDLSLTTTTGVIIFDFSSGKTTTISNLDMTCSTGNINVNFGENVTINATKISFSTSSGSISIAYENLKVYDDLELVVQTSTGSIDFSIKQTIILPWDYLIEFKVETSTGSIQLDMDIDQNLGVELKATTSTGGITIPGGSNHFKTTNFELKENQYSFELTTSTGSITACLN